MSKVFDEIAAITQCMMDAYNSGDPSGVCQLFSEDCKIMPSGAPLQSGRNAVADMFGGMMGKVKKVTLTTKEVGPDEPLQDMVFEHGVYEFFDENGQLTDRGKYIGVWKRKDGKWCLYNDIFNSDLPSK